MSKSIAIVTAINQEYDIVKSLMSKVKAGADIKKDFYKSCDGFINKIPVTLIMTNMGREAAKRAAKTALHAEKFCGILTLGYCGGLKSNLKIGEPVLASEVFLEGEPGAHIVDKKLVAKIGKVLVSIGATYHAVPMITVSKVIQEAKEKNSICKSTGALAVDMEVGEVMKVAELENIPFLAIKIVIDDSVTELPDFNSILESQGRIDKMGMASISKAQPKLIHNLKKNISIANKTLENVVADLVDELAKLWN